VPQFGGHLALTSVPAASLGVAGRLSECPCSLLSLDPFQWKCGRVLACRARHYLCARLLMIRCVLPLGVVGSE
jgi:hypothetical protein